MLIFRQTLKLFYKHISYIAKNKNALFKKKLHNQIKLIKYLNLDNFNLNIK